MIRPTPLPHKPVAFLAHSFAENDTDVVATIKKALRAAGWSVVTGEAAAPQSVSDKVRARIATAHLFVALFTRRHKIGAGCWTTTPWVIEEKAYSLGTDPRRPIVLLVEHGIPTPGETGGLNGDLEFIQFDRCRLDIAVGSLRAMLHSVAMLLR